jgi:adenine phosphoribosyltransferase
MDFTSRADELKPFIRDVPDFPKPGILFKDVTTLLKNPWALRRSLDLLVALCGDVQANKVVGIESRGFIVGSMLADRLGLGFVPVRKPGKLPSRTIRATYELEYGQDALEIHADALAAGETVLVVDDLIATGGTARAVGDLAQRLGASVASYVFLVELTFLNGREKLGDSEVRSLLRF